MLPLFPHEALSTVLFGHIPTYYSYPVLSLALRTQTRTAPRMLVQVVDVNELVSMIRSMSGKRGISADPSPEAGCRGSWL